MDLVPDGNGPSPYEAHIPYLRSKAVASPNPPVQSPRPTGHEGGTEREAAAACPSSSQASPGSSCCFVARLEGPTP